ncbi:N/A [soil metagenome]
MSKPRILRIINRLNLGGPTYNASYLSKYLDGEFETLLLSGMKDDSEESSEFIAESMGLEPMYLPDMHRSINPFRDRKAYAMVKDVIRDFKPHIVHTHAAKAGALGRLAAINSNVPVVLHTFHGHVFHSYFHPLKTRVFLEIERYLAKRSTRIIAISELQKEELTQTFKVCDPNKVETIPLGFDLSRFQHDKDIKREHFRQQYQIADNEIAIGIVGRLVPVKNHPLFIKAIKNVAARTNKPIRAFIIGDGEDRLKLEALVRELNIDCNFEGAKGPKSLLTFTSWIKDVDYAYAGLDVIALCSFNEGTPVSLIEAQAADKPIVSTEVGGIGDVVKVGRTALLSPTDDLPPFADNLLQLVNNDVLRQQMSHDAQSFVMEKYHYTRLVRQMGDLYNQLLLEKAAEVSRVR